jgi:hypothetical protein
MSWFGWGGSKGGSGSSGSSGSGSYDAAPVHSGFDAGTEFVEPNAGAFGAEQGSFASQGTSLAEEVMAEQQRALVQAVMFKLTEMSFDQCISRPGSSLSSSEVSCVQSVVSKYLDTSEFIVGRMSRAGGQHR